MTIKEQPLINAVSRMGAIPTPSHPIFSGVFSTLMVGLFGAFISFFQVFGRGTVEPADLFGPIRLGVSFGFAVAAFVYLVIIVQTIRGKNDPLIQIPFVLSGYVTIAVCVTLAWLFGDQLYNWLLRQPPLAAHF